MPDLAGMRALVVEDEAPVALLIEDMLFDFGCEIAASAASLDTARESAHLATIDFAVLDLNLSGSSAIPVAHILRERGIPFVFSTGYGASGIPAEFASYPALAKPFTADELLRKVRQALSQNAAGA
jgi:DNA-binding response OmpR family regulator